VGTALSQAAVRDLEEHVPRPLVFEDERIGDEVSGNVGNVGAVRLAPFIHGGEVRAICLCRHNRPASVPSRGVAAKPSGGAGSMPLRPERVTFERGSFAFVERSLPGAGRRPGGQTTDGGHYTGDRHRATGEKGRAKRSDGTSHPMTVHEGPGGGRRSNEGPETRTDGTSANRSYDVIIWVSPDVGSTRRRLIRQA
jgi:hypothetical protein